MIKNLSIAVFIIFICFLIFVGVSIGYSIYNKSEPSKQQLVENESTEITTLDLIENIKETEVNNINIPKITPSTKMVYKYFYKLDNTTEVIEDVPPYFLIDLTRQDLEKEFKNWQIESFSASEVVMKTVIEGESIQHYIIGDYDGFVAVFYEKEINGNNLKEITNIPLESLSIEEQEEIKKGIKISGKEELIKFLQNYEA